MNTVFLGVITLSVIVLVIFVINAIRESKKTMMSLRYTVERFENSIIPAVDELRLTILSVRKITDDIGTVSEDMKDLSGSVREISLHVRSTSEAINRAAVHSTQQISGLKAGIKAGFLYFVNNMIAKR